jgi:hypothetical protein
MQARGSLGLEIEPGKNRHTHGTWPEMDFVTSSLAPLLQRLKKLVAGGCCGTNSVAPSLEAGTVKSLQAEVAALLQGWTGENKEIRILEILDTCEPFVRNSIVQAHAKQMLTDLDDCWIGSDNWTALLELLTVKHLSTLESDSLLALLQGLVAAGQEDNNGSVVARLWYAMPIERRSRFTAETRERLAALAMQTTGKSLDPFPASVWGPKEAQDSLQSLVMEDPAELPQNVRDMGEAAVGALAKYVLAAFPGEGKGIKLVDCPEHAARLKLWGLVDLAVDYDGEFSDVAAFVAEVARCVKLNPIFLAFATAWCALTSGERMASFPVASEKRDADVREAVIHCFLLHTITKATMMEPRRNAPPHLLRQVMRAISHIFCMLHPYH